MNRIEIYLQKSAMSQFEQGDKVAEGGGAIRNSLGKMFAAGTAAVGAKWGFGKLTGGISKGVASGIDQATKHIENGGINRVLDGANHPVIDQFKAAWNKFTSPPKVTPKLQTGVKAQETAKLYAPRNKMAPWRINPQKPTITNQPVVTQSKRIQNYKVLSGYEEAARNKVKPKPVSKAASIYHRYL
jgi:hypothetical protein